MIRNITLSLILICIGCTTQKKEVGKILVSNDIQKEDSENFKVFLNDFSQDSSFQLSRIVFPFSDCYVEPTGDSICEKISKSKWIHLRLVDNENIKVIESDTKLNLDKITFSIEGIENGVGSFYYFERREKKWYLKSRLTYE